MVHVWWSTTAIYSHLRSAIVNNILYLLGGVNKDGSASPAVFTAPLDSLSRHQLKWNTYQNTPWCRPTPVVINSTHLLIVGGRGSGFKCTSDIYKLTSSEISHRWEAVGCIPSARSALAAVSTGDNRVIVIGGENDKGVYTNTAWIGSCEPLAIASHYSWLHTSLYNCISKTIY